MASQLDEILGSLIGGTLTVDEACQAVAAAARLNPSGTQLWPMLIESRVTQQQISATIGRALCDALENFEPDKTMWLAPSKSTQVERSSGDVLRTPTTASDRAKAEVTPIENAEQLRAFLWDPPTASGGHSIEHIPILVPPPRKKPGAIAPLPLLEIGTIVKNRYRLEAHLGFGGIGQVFAATDLEAERKKQADPRVTLKMIAVDLKREPQALMAMKIAVARIKSLRHPNIVTTYGLEADQDRLFVVMEPLFGRWLGERIRAVRNVGIAQELAWPIVEGIANGLAHAHTNGIVHSDLSPYAVFMTNDGTPKIMNFGLVHALPTSNEALDLLDTMTLRAYSEAYTTNVWATYGTPHPADDLYPLGVIAYELLTGRHPYQRSSLTVARQKQLMFPPIPGLKRRAAKLIAHCLAFDRHERPDDAARFLRRMQGPAWLRFILGERLSIVASR
jgi:tRNA A-37 threonylcarbamoyl transferase component Bud32